MAINYYDNHLGLIKGWFVGRKYSIERYLYSLHRITGIGILIYFFFHIFVTTTRAFGAEAWNKTMDFLHKPIFLFGEYLVFVAFCIHGLNGIRLILLELGFMVGKPIEPVYPYKTSIMKQKPLMFFLMFLSLIFIILGGYDFFLGGK